MGLCYKTFFAAIIVLIHWYANVLVAFSHFHPLQILVFKDVTLPKGCYEPKAPLRYALPLPVDIILRLSVANTLSYYGTKLMMTLKSFIIQSPGSNVIKRLFLHHRHSGQISCGLYYKHLMTVNDASGVVSE